MQPAIRYAAAALLAGLASQGASAACYQVYGADQQLVYRSTVPPVDMAPQLHQTVPQVVPRRSSIRGTKRRERSRRDVL